MELNKPTKEQWQSTIDTTEEAIRVGKQNLLIHEKVLELCKKEIIDAPLPKPELSNPKPKCIQ